MNNFSEVERQILRELVDKSIHYGLKKGRPLPVCVSEYPANLAVSGASFVTLEINDELRGCIGSLEAHRPLAIDVSENAYAAAFEDPRFVPLTEDEYPLLTKYISVLSKPEPIIFQSEEDLLRKIVPNVDGLLLIENGRHGTFLPSVWESLPDKREFLRHLKVKAGLTPDYWSNTVQVKRYTTEII